jgi:hypothetical protein
MKNAIINFLYWADSTAQLALMKIITHNYKIDNIIFNSFFRSMTIPYYIYKLQKYQFENKNKILVAKWYDVLNGILDQLDITLTYIGFSGLTIGEYITLRTLSIFFGGLYLIFYYKKLLSLQKMISMGLIFLACVVLLGFYNGGSFFNYLICIVSSIAYSLISFIIEINIKTDEERSLSFYWTKTISYTIAIFVGTISEFNYNTISSIFNEFLIKDVIIILSIEFLISLLENYYYYLKILLISAHPKNGSIITQFLDIIRRFTLIIIGVCFFSEVYTPVIFISLALMLVGSIVGLVDYHNLVYIYETKFKKTNSINIVNLPNVSIV